MTVSLHSVDSSFRIGDGEKDQDSFNESPAIVAGADKDNQDHDATPLHAKESSLTVEILRSELSATETHVSRDLAVARRLGKVVSFRTLMLLHEGLDSLLSSLRKLGFSLGTGHSAGFAEVADVALVIELGARACAAVNNSIKVLTVETLHVSLSSHVRHLLSEVAFVVAVSTIIRRPRLVVRFVSSRCVCSFALRLMELSEIDVNESSFGLLFTLFCFIFLKLIHTVNKELLGGASGLSNDVLHMDGVVGDLDSLPGLSIIPSEF